METYVPLWYLTEFFVSDKSSRELKYIFYAKYRFP